MKSTLEALWKGEIAPGETCGVGEPEIEKLVGLLEKSREKFIEELSERQKEIFENYVKNSDKFTYLLSEQAFCDGFCLAGKLMADIYQ